MLYLPSGFLKFGMVLARGVPSANPMLPLLVKGQTLTEDTIKMVTLRGIKGLYIENKLSDDIKLEEFIEPEQKQVLLANIKSEFNKLQKQNRASSFRNVSQMAESLVMNVLERDTMLCNIIDIRDYDNYTYSHSLYVGIIGVVVAKQLGFNAKQLNDVATAGILHDIGKLDIPCKIINKPAPLNQEEFELMKQHPMRAVDRLRGALNCREAIVQGVASHHEYYDGTGYPRGIQGDNIPLYGRILAIADVYDALSSKRSYREPWSQGRIIDYITSRSGIQFDPEMLSGFLKGISVYPVGSMVKLSDGSMGIVLKNHAGYTLRPTVRLISPPERMREEVNLAQGNFHTTVLDAVHESDHLKLPE